MGYYDRTENVEAYIQMAEGYDGREFVPVLEKYVRRGASVLELGMGPGKDLRILGESFQVTGSDVSKVFLDRYRKTHPDADLLLLDAATMDTDRTFDCIYSNKVLHHLTSDELRQSLGRQSRVLNAHGILFHTFWHGDGEQQIDGLRFVYYTEESFGELLGDVYEVLEMERYSEIDEGDSFFAVLKKL